MSDFLLSLADEAADLSSAPSDDQLSTVQEAGMLLVTTDRRVSLLEEALSDAKEKRKELAYKTLPDLMDKIGMDHIGLSEAGADLELKPYYHASIPKDWEEEKREAAFAHLEELGGGDTVRTTLIISAGKGDLENMRAFYVLFQKILSDPTNIEQFAGDWLAKYSGDIEPVSANSSLDLGIPWNTLTSFVKEQMEKDEQDIPVKLDVLNATAGQVVKIKKRKD